MTREGKRLPRNYTRFRLCLPTAVGQNEPARLGPQQVDGPVGPGRVETRGADDFIESIGVALESERKLLRRLADWAIGLERQGLAELWTTSGASGRKVLKPCLPDEGVGLVTIFNDGRGTMAVWRTRFQTSAPGALSCLEGIGVEVGQGNNLPEVTDEILGLLAEAYREAADSQA